LGLNEQGEAHEESISMEARLNRNADLDFFELRECSRNK
jgi:hypothetical protein